MISTCIPVLAISIAILLSYLCANGFDMSMSAASLQHGLYGIGISAVGMLSTLGITLALMLTVQLLTMLVVMLR